MKKLWIILVSATAFIGCSKDKDNVGPDQEYYFRAQVDGQNFDFLHDALFQGGGNDNKWQHIVIGGYVSDYDASKPIEQWPHAFGFDLWNEGGDFPPGTYTQNGGGPYDDEDPLNYTIDMEYHIQTADQGTVQYDARETGDFTLKIIEVNKLNGIKGTFEGTISHEDNLGDQMVIENGEFYLPLDEIVNP